MELVDDQVGKRSGNGSFVSIPFIGIGGTHLYDGSSLSVRAYCLSEDTWRLSPSDIKGIELAE